MLVLSLFGQCKWAYSNKIQDSLQWDRVLFMFTILCCKYIYLIKIVMTTMAMSKVLALF